MPNILKIKPIDNWLKKNNSIGFSLVDEFDLSKSSSWADYVVGLESYMLVLAMKAKKKVFTLLPLNKKKFRNVHSKYVNYVMHPTQCF